jgi:glycosyltransferase involved in cell wall biosynthesis
MGAFIHFLLISSAGVTAESTQKKMMMARHLFQKQPDSVEAPSQSQALKEYEWILVPLACSLALLVVVWCIFQVFYFCFYPAILVASSAGPEISVETVFFSGAEHEEAEKGDASSVDSDIVEMDDENDEDNQAPQVPTVPSLAESASLEEIFDPDLGPQPLLSIVIPAYNEQERLPVMLQEAHDYFYFSESTDIGKSDAESESSSPPVTAPSTPARQTPPMLSRLSPSFFSRRKKKIEDSKETLPPPPFLPKALELLQQCCDARFGGPQPFPVTIEWIVVSDGSTDETGEAFRSFVKHYYLYHDYTSAHFPKLRRRRDAEAVVVQLKMTYTLVTLKPNTGKGAAVQAGILLSLKNFSRRPRRGHFVLMVDADGATDFGPGLEKVAAGMEQLLETRTPSDTQQQQLPPSFVLGSRAHLRQDQAHHSERGIVRVVLTNLFQFFVNWIVTGATSPIQDTQCGFKLWTNSAAVELFSRLHIQRWAFDTELIFLASHLAQTIPMSEVAVPWHEVEGSKLNTGERFQLLKVGITMLRDMMCIRLCYTLGIWSMNTTGKDPARSRATKKND